MTRLWIFQNMSFAQFIWESPANLIVAYKRRYGPNIWHAPISRAFVIMRLNATRHWISTYMCIRAGIFQSRYTALFWTVGNFPNLYSCVWIHLAAIYEPGLTARGIVFSLSLSIVFPILRSFVFLKCSSSFYEKRWCVVAEGTTSWRLQRDTWQ